MKLALSLATRGRPELLFRTIMIISSNIRNPETVLMIQADADDQPTLDFLENLQETGLYKLHVSIRPREDTVAAKWNRVIDEIPDADVYMPVCDDGPIITPGFDDMVLDAASIPPDGIAFVYNRMENASFPGIQAVTREVVDLMGGEIYVPLFPYWFVDHWLDDIAKMSDRIFFCDVDHDADTNRPGTMEMREPGWWGTFFDACYLKRRATAFKIIDATMDTTWRKEQLKRNVPLHEYRSKWINDCVRDNYGLAEYAKQNSLDREFVERLLIFGNDTDVRTVRDWLDIKHHDDIRKGWRAAHNQQCNNAYKKYASEGVAPTPQIASVFAHFKAIEDRYRRIRAAAVAMMRDELLPMLKAA